MTETEIERLLSLLREEQRVGPLAELAWRQELPALDFRATLAAMTEAAKHGKVLVEHVTGETGNDSRYSDAERAWRQIGGVGAVAAIGERLQRGEPVSVADRALYQVRQTVRYQPETEARWAFLRAYNEIAAADRRDDLAALGTGPRDARPLPVIGRRV